MATIGEILVNLKAEVAEFNAQMTSARDSIGQIATSAASTKSEVSALAGIMGTAESAVAGYVAAWSVREITEFIDRQVEATAAIGETAAKIGVGVETYQELAFAAKQVGVEHEILDKSLEFFTKTIGLASLGVEKAKKPLEELFGAQGAAAEASKPIGEVFSDVATKIAGLSSESQRAAVASELFGKGWAGIANLLAEGGDGINRLKREAEDLGIVMSQQDVTAADATAKKFRELGDVISADLKKAIVDISPELITLATDIEKIAKAMRTMNGDPADDLKNLSVFIAQTQSDLKAYQQSLADVEAGKSILSKTTVTATLAEAHYKAEIADATKLLKEQQAEYDKLAASMAAPPAPSPGKRTGTVLPDASDSGAAEIAKQAADYQKTLDDLTRSLDADRQHQELLRAAYLAGGNAVEVAKEQIAGMEAMQKLVTAARRDDISVTNEQLKAVQSAAEGDQRAKNDAEQTKNEIAAKDHAQRDYQQTLAQLKSTLSDTANDENLLAAATGKGAQAVREAQAEVAGLAAQRKLLTAAEKDGITATKEDLAAAYDLGASASRAKTQIDSLKNESKDFQHALIEAGRTVSSQFADAIVTGKDLGTVFQSLLKDLEKLVLELLVVGPLMKALGDAITGGGFSLPIALPNFKFAHGAAFAGHPAASGDIYSSPTVGLFGEAGPEAIFPLARTAAGDLGVRSTGGGGNQGEVRVYVMNVPTSHQVKSATSQDSPGGRDIVIELEERLAGRMRRGSALGREVQNSYGGQLQMTPR